MIKNFYILILVIFHYNNLYSSKVIDNNQWEDSILELDHNNEKNSLNNDKKKKEDELLKHKNPLKKKKLSQKKPLTLIIFFFLFIIIILFFIKEEYEIFKRYKESIQQYIKNEDIEDKNQDLFNFISEKKNKNLIISFLINEKINNTDSQERIINKLKEFLNYENITKINSQDTDNIIKKSLEKIKIQKNISHNGDYNLSDNSFFNGSDDSNDIHHKFKVNIYNYKSYKTIYTNLIEYIENILFNNQLNKQINFVTFLDYLLNRKKLQHD